VIIRLYNKYTLKFIFTNTTVTNKNPKKDDFLAIFIVILGVESVSDAEKSVPFLIMIIESNYYLFGAK
jgi:hypothetical protein